jgi:hypothetical protein
VEDGQAFGSCRFRSRSQEEESGGAQASRQAGGAEKEEEKESLTSGVEAPSNGKLDRSTKALRHPKAMSRVKIVV